MTPDAARDLLRPFRAAMYDFDLAEVARSYGQMAPDALARFAHPLGDTRGPDQTIAKIWAPLARAMPDLERRDQIVIAGRTPEGATWVGCGGYYCGTFIAPWLDIPPTGHLAHLRFHEFYRVEEGRVTQIQALWDIPELMMQAGAWPMGPSLGREWHIPGPATQDGLGPHDPAGSAGSTQHIIDMLTALKRHPSDPDPAAMEMERFWHPKMTWYGPSGIGTARGIAGFRHWHQIPFLNGMPDRGQYLDEVEYHFFGEGTYAAVTGWPDMVQSITHGGWLGIAPAGKKIEMRSLDFWRLEGGLIRENWVMVDLLHMWDQIGVDVLGRMREFNKARHVAPLPALDWRAVT